MKNFLILALILISGNLSIFAQDKAIRLIVRGDDMGYAHSGNEAILKSYKEGIQTSIEVLVPAPWFPEAVKMLQENPQADVGIHLTLTSEWDNMKWRPISDCPSLKDSEGYFFPMIHPNKNYPGQALRENNWMLSDVEKEFRAQIELALEKIPWISHISGHMGCTNMDESVKELTKKLAREYKIDIDPAEHDVKNVRYEGPHQTFEEKKKSFLKMLSQLEPGNTYLFVDHPGLDTPELRAIHHIGYEYVAVDRQGVTNLWTDPEIKMFIEDKGIQLISYKELKNRK